MTAQQERTRIFLAETIEKMKVEVARNPSDDARQSLKWMEEHYRNYVLSDGRIV